MEITLFNQKVYFEFKILTGSNGAFYGQTDSEDQHINIL